MVVLDPSHMKATAKPSALQLSCVASHDSEPTHRRIYQRTHSLRINAYYPDAERNTVVPDILAA